MRLYLDSNVYAFVVERKELREVRKLLRGTEVLVTDFHLTESYRIPDYTTRVGRVRAITTLHPIRSQPAGFLDALEVRSEVARCREEWLNADPDETLVDEYLGAAKQTWTLMRANPGFQMDVPEFGEPVKAAIDEVLDGFKRTRELN